MADNITVQDATGASVVVKAKDNSSVFTPYHNVMLNDAAPSVNTGAADTGTQRVVLASGAASIAKAEDAASADGDVGVPMLAVRQTTPANSSGTDGDYEFLKVLNGLLWTQALQPQVTCSTDITRPADTTGYVANDNLSDSTSSPTSGGFTLTGAARVSGGSGVITDLIVTSSAPAALQGEVWIFDSAVTNINDNAAFAISDAEVKTLVAIVPFTLEAGTNNSQAHKQNLAIGFTTVGSANLRYLVKVKASYTPISGEVITVRTKILQTN